MEDKELHPVVELLLARMESHPEEFLPEKDDDRYAIRDVDANRWWRAMSEVQEFANEQEKKVIAAKLRELRLQQAHEWAMDELLNGDERRRKEREEYEITAQTAIGAGSMGARLRNTLSPAVQQAYSQMQQQKYLADLQAYQNIFPNPQYDPATDTYDLGSGLKMTKTQVEDNPGMVATIKKALGI